MAELTSSRYYSFPPDEFDEEEDEDVDPAAAVTKSYLPPRRVSVDHNPNAPRYIKDDSFEDLLA